MRLKRQGDRFVAQFSLVWEVSYLAEQEERWVPFYLQGHLEQPIGMIHSKTHEIRLHTDQSIPDRQLVVLGR
jgi:hypothetical protein